MKKERPGDAEKWAPARLEERFAMREIIHPRLDKLREDCLSNIQSIWDIVGLLDEVKKRL